MFLIAISAATISASGVECETLVCFLLIAAKGKNVLGPDKHKNAPDVELKSGFSPQFASA